MGSGGGSGSEKRKGEVHLYGGIDTLPQCTFIGGYSPHPEYGDQLDPMTSARIPKDPPSRCENPKADPAALAQERCAPRPTQDLRGRQGIVMVDEMFL